jgi:putative membrane protein
MIEITLSSLSANQWWNSGGSSHPWFFFGFLFWLLPVFVFGLIIFLAARWLYNAGGQRNNNNNNMNNISGGSRAVAILEERYAKGEITKEQFEQMRRDLQSQ